MTLKLTLPELARRYSAALRRHLDAGPRASLRPALRLGHQAVALDIEMLALARMHELALVGLAQTGLNAARRRQAEAFFTEASSLIEDTHRAARQSKVDLHRLKDSLGRRTRELAGANRRLEHGILRREAVELALKESGEHYARLLKESLQLQQSLRDLTHKVLAAQEDERKKLSLELQDEISQTLLGINVRLLSLKQEAHANTKGLKKEIASTQRLVAQSGRTVRRADRKIGNA